MDHPGRLRGQRAFRNGPGPRLLGPDGEIGLQMQERIARADQPVETRLLQPHLRQEHRLLGRVKLGDLLLDPGRDHHMRIALGRRHRRHPVRMGIALRRLSLLHVADIEHGLCGQKLQEPPAPPVLLGHADRARRPACLQRLPRRLEQPVLVERLLVAALDLAGQVRKPLLDRLQIGQHQLGLDRGRIRDRVDTPLDMGDVVILETAQHMGDRIDLADIGQELVAQALALRGALHQPRDVDKGHPRRNHLARLGDGGQRLEPRIGDRDIADIGLDRAEGEIRGLCGGGPRQRVEERRLAHIRQSDDSHAKAHADSPGSASRRS